MRLLEEQAKILRGPHEDLENYLGAVDQLRADVRFFSSKKSFKSIDGIISHTNSLLAKAMLKLEDEFKHLLTNYSKPVEPDRLFDYLPNSLRPSASGQQSSGGGKIHSDKPSIETVTFTLPTLIPPRVIPLLFRIYTDTRAAVLDQSLKKLGVERLSKEACNRKPTEFQLPKQNLLTAYTRITKLTNSVPNRL